MNRRCASNREVRTQVQGQCRQSLAPYLHLHKRSQDQVSKPGAECSQTPPS